MFEPQGNEVSSDTGNYVCPKCKHFVKSDQDACGNCQYVFTIEDKKAMEQQFHIKARRDLRIALAITSISVVSALVFILYENRI